VPNLTTTVVSPPSNPMGPGNPGQPGG
jgi:hypothetical protein